MASGIVFGVIWLASEGVFMMGNLGAYISRSDGRVFEVFSSDVLLLATIIDTTSGYIFCARMWK